MPTLMQKIRLAFRGWNRRRKEDAAGREQEFLARNTGWVKPPVQVATKAPVLASSSAEIDVEGLTVAFLDDSGRIAHYLDTENGEVLDVRDGAALEPPRFRRVPGRTAKSEAADRHAFTASLESPQRERLAAASQSAEEFRKALSADRALEKGWYNFKNDRAIETIEKWLRESV
jgi:hypothetical protein